MGTSAFGSVATYRVQGSAPGQAGDAGMESSPAEKDLGVLLYPPGSPASSSGAPSGGQTWSCRSGARGGPSNDARAGTPLLGELGLLSLGKSRLRGDLRAACERAGEGPLTRGWSNRTRDNVFKPKEGIFTLVIRKKFFTLRVVKPWPRLPSEVVDALPLETFQARLDRALNTLGWLKMSLLAAGGFG